MEKQKVLSYAEQFEAEFMRLYYELDMATAPEKRKPFIFDSILIDIYPLVFKPTGTQANNSKSKLLYHNIQDIEEVTEMYIKLCMRFNGVIKYNAFSNLTGINKYTMDLWHKSNNTDSYIFNLNNATIEEECKHDIYIVYDGDNNKLYKNTNNYYIDKVVNNRCMYSEEEILLSIKRFDVKKKLHDFMVDENTNGLSGDTVGYTIRANNDEDLGKLYDPKKIVLQQQAKTTSLSISDLKLLE